jgi:hypothetical protein
MWTEAGGTTCSTPWHDGTEETTWQQWSSRRVGAWAYGVLTVVHEAVLDWGRTVARYGG